MGFYWLILLILTFLWTVFFIYFKKNGDALQSSAEAVKLFKRAVTGSGMLLLFTAVLLLLIVPEMSYSSQPTPVQPGVPAAAGLGYLAAAIAVGLGSLGAGIAVGMAATAGLGAISENPRLFGNAIVFVGLAEGIAIYGLIIAIMVLSRL